ncbi:MAG: hypothetical protein M3N93_09025, partial [Acidobacteriota bacterium]|nr:hypothetical protein [Acidobacteriota bacterium]
MKTLFRCRIAVAGLLMAAAGLCPVNAQEPPAPQPATPQPAPIQTQPALPPPAVPGGLNLNNASLFEVINLLAQDLHINYILDPGVKNGTVTINTYGAVRDLDLRPLLETILRMNGLAMVQVGNIFRIVPSANIARQPVSPISETDGSKIADDERLVLNLVFLRYVTSAEMNKILLPFTGEGAQITSYDPANLLIILDNSRNMRRALELINMFDSDTFAGQRVRAFETKNGRPSDIAKELDEVFKAYALTGDKGGGAVKFLPINRINTILAVAPNPGAFAEVEKWIQKLDIQARRAAGSVDNYVYKLRYGKAEVLGSVINQLYGNCGSTGGGMYGSMTGNSSYPASNSTALGVNGGNSYGNNGNGSGNGAYGGGYGGSGMSSAPCVNNGAPGMAGGAAPPMLTPFNSTPPATAGGTASTTPGSASDQTGTYLTQGAPPGRGSGPRIIPNPYDNTLLVQGTPQEWEQIRHLLDQLDVSPRQVLIDAKIYEVDLSGDLTLGVESYLQKTGTSNSKVSSTQLLGSAGTAGFSLTAGTLVGQSRQLLAYLQAAETRTKTKVLSAPSVIATDSIAASITVGDSVP